MECKILMLQAWKVMSVLKSNGKFKFCLVD